MKLRLNKLIVFTFIIFTCFLINAEDNIEINFIDVGKGDSIFIHSDNGENILIDTGNPVSGYNVVQFLKSKKIEKNDHLILTHADIDHIGGIFYILQMFQVKNIYDNGDNIKELSNDSPFHKYYLKLRKQENYKILNNQINLNLKTIKLETLWPPQKFPKKDYNNSSIVLKLSYGKFKCLLLGDILKEVEEKLLKQNIDLKSDIIKIGHHGSKETTSIDFLNKVSPKVAIISVDNNNRHNYPSFSVIKRIEDQKIKLYKTSTNGDISIKAFTNGKYQISTSR